MGLARHGRIPTVLVGDIDRGGVFAAMHGTLALLDAADQALMAGLRGQQVPRRRVPARARAGHPGTADRPARFYGVLPWRPDLWLDSEDSLALDRARGRTPTGRPHCRSPSCGSPASRNFTDVDALVPGAGGRRACSPPPRALASADLVVLPGTRATLADLAWLRARGPRPTPSLVHAARGGAGARHLRRLPDAGPARSPTPTASRAGGRSGRRAPPARRAHRVHTPRRCCGCRRYGAGRARVGLRDPPRPDHSSARRRGLPRRSPSRPCSARCGTAASRATSCAGPG